MRGYGGNPQLYSPQFMAALAQQLPPGITATGKPGELNIEGVGVRKFADMRQDRLYDRVQIPAANAAGTELVWFRDIQGKTRLETNMTQSSKLPEGQQAVVYSIAFIVRDDCPPKDKAEIYATGYGEMVLDDDNRVSSGPLIFFPQKYGMYGNIMTTKNDSDEGVVTNGIPSPGANPRMMIPLYLSENRTFRFTLHFYEACDLPTAAATYAWVALDCLISRPMR